MRRLRIIAGLAWQQAHWLLPAAAAALALSSTHILLGEVINQSGDDTHHLLGEHALLYAIQAGDNPFGPLGLDFGQPMLRFYQCLFYLWNVAVHLVTDVGLITVHNATTIFCFALSPFAYLYFLRQLGLGKLSAGLGSFASLL
jgi:hypothetical protein